MSGCAVALRATAQQIGSLPCSMAHLSANQWFGLLITSYSATTKLRYGECSCAIKSWYTDSEGSGFAVCRPWGSFYLFGNPFKVASRSFTRNRLLMAELGTIAERNPLSRDILLLYKSFTPNRGRLLDGPVTGLNLHIPSQCLPTCPARPVTVM